MTKLIVFLVSIAFVTTSYAQCNDWTVQSRSPEFIEPAGVAMDPFGNTYSVGTFGTEAWFNNDTLQQGWTSVIYVTKHSPNGNLNWTQKFTVYIPAVFTVSVTASNSAVYLCGTYSGSLWVGNDIFHRSGNGLNSYLIKLDIFGNLVWVKNFDNDGASHAEGLLVGKDDNVYISGYFNDTLQLDNQTLVAHPSGFDVYLAKLAPDGTVIWALQSYDSGHSAGAFAIAEDPEGNILLGGLRSGPFGFGSGHTVNGGNGYLPYVAKFDSVGTILWVRSAAGWGSGGLLNSYLNDLTTDEAGNIYFAAEIAYDDVITWGGQVFSGADGGALIGKYDPAGNLIWAQNFGAGKAWERAASVDIGPMGDLWFTGVLRDTFQVGGTVYQTHGYTDLFIARADTSGQILDLQLHGGEGQEFCYTAAMNHTGALAVQGKISGGPYGVFGGDTLHSTPGWKHGYLLHTCGSYFVNRDEGTVPEWELSLFPVPFLDELQIQGSLGSEVSVHIKVMSLAGTVMLDAEAVCPGGNLHTVIDLSSLPAGLFLVEIETPSGRQVERVVKQ